MPPPPSAIEIHRRAAAIRVDGDLADPGWSESATIDRFYETSPGDNARPAVATIASLVYDDRYLYIGVHCKDPEPIAIRSPYVERDKIGDGDDFVAVVLDARNDGRVAIELRVNPRGIQTDAVLNDGNGVRDFSPDFVFDAAAALDGDGWTAEFRVPLSTLRYSSAEGPAWKVLVYRNYPRNYRYSYSSVPIPRGSNCVVCHAQRLTGLEARPRASQVTAVPYVTAQRISEPASTFQNRQSANSSESRQGLDVKWTPAATATVDLTVNPDYSEIEADVPQITANQRFAVFYPEKRPFFLEGTDLFDTPLPVVYTRAITSPRFGVRGTGEIGASSYTVLVAEDRGGGLTIVPRPSSSIFAPRDFRSLDLVGRVRRRVGRRSYVGGVLTSRDIRGGGHNRVMGTDFQWRPNADADSITGQLLLSDNRNPREPELSPLWDGERSRSHAAYVFWKHQDRASDWGLTMTEIGKAFRADLGFLPQNGYRELKAYVGRHYYPAGQVFSHIRPSLFVMQQSGVDGSAILRRISPGMDVSGVRGLQAYVFLRAEQVRVRDELLDQIYVKWQADMAPSRRFSHLSLSGTAGQMIDFANGRVGDGVSVALSASARPVDSLALEAYASRDWLDVAQGRVYTQTISRAKVIYHFTSKALIRLIAQHVATTRAPELYSSTTVKRHEGGVLGSVLFSYVVNLQTVLYLGYGDNQVISVEDRLVRTNSSLFLKFSYAFRM